MIQRILGDSASQEDEEVIKMCKEVAATMYIGRRNFQFSCERLRCLSSSFNYQGGADTVSVKWHTYCWLPTLTASFSRMP